MPVRSATRATRRPQTLDVAARLRALGYTVRADGSSEGIRHAVMAFQKVHGLPRDGIAGPRTLRALGRPRAVDPGTGPRDHVVVDLSDQVLLVVRDGRVRMVLNAATGDPTLPDGRGSATPVGTFRVGRKVAGAEHAHLGTLYWPSYFTGGVAVHGSPSVPAFPASHGCVRVPMHLSRTMFDVMRAGMVVQVRR
jgi:lipoprotein-anchoring transpeptidase ErfK/SrfK